jgi:formylglycine-generating enzyme required for sulfatase activity
MLQRSKTLLPLVFCDERRTHLLPFGAAPVMQMAGAFLMPTSLLPCSTTIFTNADMIRNAVLLAIALLTANATAEGADPFRDCGLCPKMVAAPAGTFTMGSADEEAGRENDEGPAHQVSLANPFALSQYEITVGEFAFFLAVTGYEPPPGCWYIDPTTQQWQENPTGSWQDTGFTQKENHPVTCVNWPDAQAYVAWLREKTGEPYRLPTEAEWEYSIRAGTTTSRYWGELDAEACEYGNAIDETARLTYKDWNHVPCVDGFIFTSPVGIFAANPWGLHDMAGNVWEWVSDCWINHYRDAPSDGATGTTGDCGRRVIRGAAWDDEPDDLRSANRLAVPADRRYNTIGIRVARDIR